MSSLSRNLSALFEDQAVTGSNPMDTAVAVSKELEAAQQRIKDLQHQLEMLQQELTGALALTVRRLNPGLNVGVNRDGCKIGYKTKHLLLMPDVKNGVWKAKSKDARFASNFTKLAGQALVMSNDLSLLAQASVAYFKRHYKTLGEDIGGTGLVVVENKMSSLIALAEWHRTRKPKPKLNSRLARQVASL